MIVGYVRVSTADQNYESQIELLESRGAQKIFSEKISAKNNNRVELKKMLGFVRDGDTVIIRDFSRLARSTKDLLDIVEQLKNKNVTLISAKEQIDTSTVSGKLMLTMIGAINEFERENMLDRQREGIRIAQQNGAYKGRKKIKLSQFIDFDMYYSKYVRRKISKVKFAELLKISRPVLDRLIKEYEELNNIE
jgi:DNA invertase Pin-like site-specific DNA recombinase